MLHNYIMQLCMLWTRHNKLNAIFYSDKIFEINFVLMGLWCTHGQAIFSNWSTTIHRNLAISSNNPNGRIQHIIMNGTSTIIHNLSYYWPQYIGHVVTCIGYGFVQVSSTMVLAMNKALGWIMQFNK
jgi:hypothetical protein